VDRRETAGVMQDLVVLALLVFMTWGRFGAYAFAS